MIDLKADFSGGLNLDDSYYILPKNCYIDAQNITRDAVAGSNDRSITNVIGNRASGVITTSYTIVKTTYQNATIFIESPDVISAGTRTLIELNQLPSLTPRVVLDYTSTQSFSATDYCNELATAMQSSISVANLWTFTGTIADGVYTVSPSSTTGVGFGSSFELYFNSNTYSGSVILYGGTNYKAGNPFAGADFITFNGSLFGGVDGVDDVVLYVDAVSLPSGIISNGSAAGPPPNFYFEYNDDIANPFNAYQWSYYTITLGRANAGYTCIGAYPNTIRNTIIYFLHNNLGYHQILEYNIQTELVTKILENLVDTGGVDILNFDVTKKITSINVYNRDEGDLLYFLDTLGRPTGLDIEKFKNGAYTPVTRDIINVIKRPPLSPPSVLYLNDTTSTTNNLIGKLFRFKYRYIYDDLTKSVCSPISIVPLPDKILDEEYTNDITNNNNIQVLVDIGEKDVSRIQILMSYVNKTNDWSDFALVDTIYRDKVGLYANFYAHGDAFITNAQITFGYNGIILPGTEINIYLNTISTSITYLLATYITVDGDTISSIVAALEVSLSSIGLPGIFDVSYTSTTLRFSYFKASYVYDKTTISNPGGTYQYTFYNDSTYPYIDINESIQLYDYVPDSANAQELANGNVLVYGGVTEGYNNDLQPNVQIEILTTAFPLGSTLGAVASNFRNFGGVPPKYQTFNINFSGIAPIGTRIVIILYKPSSSSFVTICDYYTILDDSLSLNTLSQNVRDEINSLTSSTHATAFITGVNQLTINTNDTVGANNYKVFYSINITPPGAVSLDKNSISTWPFSTQRFMGMVYFDKNGKTNGVVFSEKLFFPKYNQDAVTSDILLPYINTKVYHIPPIWAYSFQFVMTKEATQFLYWEVGSFGYTNKQDGRFFYFNITTLTLNATDNPTTAKVLSWSFQDGDRIRIVKNVTDNTIIPSVESEIYGILVNPEVNGQPQNGTFVKVKKTAAISTYFNSTKSYIIQLYRPEQPQPNNENKVFYEFGQQYAIIDPTTTNRLHAGMLSDQTNIIPAEFNFYNGDVYYRKRILQINNSNILQYPAIDRNFVDTYISAVNSIDGRPNVIDVNARRAYYSTLVRFGQPYQPNTNTNNLNRFYYDDFDQYDYTYGDIMRFKIRDRFMRVFQKLKVGMVPLYQQMVKNLDSENLVISDKLLNPVQYYQGDVGIGNNPESLASFNYADFFTSNIKGAICRASQDGVEFISATNKVNSWANAQVGDIDGRTMIGAFDQRLGNYILALGPSVTNNEVTIVYDQEIGNFETFLTLYPEMMVTIGTTLISFRDGVVYVHNNAPYNTWYGAPTADSSITPVFNENPYQKKTFLAVSEISSTLWDIPNMETDLNSYGTTKQTTNIVDSDFAQLEGSYEATILRDINSQGGILGGDTMKGKYIIPTFRKISPSTLVVLNIVSLKYIDSPLTNR